jgi:HPt (histidine-containing phosphotransfer) domain-containing protein
VSESGDTSTSQMSQYALAVRFLTRAQGEVAQMRACLPDEPLPIDGAAVAQVERMAHRIASGAEAFGFPEIDAIAGAIELMSQENARRTVRERLELAVRLTEKISALEVYLEYELAELSAQSVPDELSLAVHLPGFRARQK